MQNYQIIAKRKFDGIVNWLKENKPDVLMKNPQAVRGSDEEAIWHMGYAAALRDMIEMDIREDIK